MTLEQISYLGQTIAAVAVVITLIYAALQFRIYTKAAQEARLIASSSDIQETRRMIATDAECARIYYAGLVDFQKLDTIEQHRFDAMMQLIVTQVIYLSRFRDIPAEFEPGAVFGQPGTRQWWQKARDRYAPHVVRLIDGLFTAIDATSTSARPA